MEHMNVHIKMCVFTAPDAHSAYGHIMHTSLRYTRTSIQPADKQIEHLITSYKLLLLRMESEKKKKQSMAIL